jgi:hypothetical protein
MQMTQPPPFPPDSTAAGHLSAPDRAAETRPGAGQPPAARRAADPAVDVATAGRAQTLRTLRDLAIDLGIPLGSYYLLRDGLGASLWLSLAVSSAGPAVRSVWALQARHELNLLATLMLLVNVAGIVVSFLTGDPRAMIAKDSIVSSVIAFTMLGSVLVRRPLMTPGLRLFITKGNARREAAWDRLRDTSAGFRRLEGLYTVIWGAALLAECIARCVGAYTLPVTTMVWLGGVMTISAIGLAIMLGGVAAGPMLHRVERETAGPLPAGPGTDSSAAARP